MGFSLNNILDKIIESIVNHGIDWIITMVVTYISVRLATKKHYYSVRKSNVRPLMEQGLKLILDKDIIPANAKSIFVENKGRCVIHWRKYKCTHPFEPLRKTITTVGGMENSTSEARARFWGVLGLAYLLKGIVVYDFSVHSILIYQTDIVRREAVEKNDKKYYYDVDIGGKKREQYLSDKDTDRNIMIAVPLINNKGKIVGGVTFDVDCEISERSNPNNKKKYLIGENAEVLDICKKLDDLGSNIYNAYFNEK